MNTENIDNAILTEIEAFSIRIAREAGHILLEHFNKPMEIRYKDEKNTDPVTIADHLSEEYLTQAIKERFPDHNIVSEEEGISDHYSSHITWVLDPLDGTANFINGLPFFAVSVGVLWRNLPVVGSIYVPVSHKATDGVYHASLGQGAFLNDEKLAVAVESPKRPLSEMPAQFSSQFRLSGKSRKEPIDTRNLGSIALELALTSCGIFQFALFNSPKLWDVLSGILLVKEAGGSVLIYEKKSKNWKHFNEIEIEKAETKTPPEIFQNWSFPLVAGASDTVNKVVRDIRIHHPILDRMNNLRLWRNKTSRKTPDKEAYLKKS